LKILENCIAENLEVEAEEEVDEDEKDSYMLHSEVEKTVKKKATDDGDDVLKWLGEVGLKIMTVNQQHV
jgi:hypothetical protein